MNITGIHINYFHVCKRKLWLYSNEIAMEHTSDLVHQGDVIHKSSYIERSDKYREITIGNIKIDYYDSHNKIIHETKKSDREYISHVWQLKYYIYILKLSGMSGVSGKLEYPKQRKVEDVFLLDTDVENIENQICEIHEIVNNSCPAVINMNKCKRCSYCDFCYAGE